MRSLSRPLAVLAMAGGVVLATALPAWAHYPVVSGSSVCSTGHYVITWSVRNSESSQKMTVDSATASGGIGSVAALLGVYGGSASKTAASTVAGATSATVTLSVHGTWPDGVRATKTASVILKGDCKPPVTTTTTTTTLPPPPPTTTTTTTAPPPPPPTTTTTTTAPPPPPASTTTTTAAPPDPSTTTTTTAARATTTTTAAPTTTTTTAKTEVLGETVQKAEPTTTTTTPQVLGEQVTAPAHSGALPHTGAAVGLLVFVAGGLLWVGLPLSRYKRRDEEQEES